MAAAAAEVSRSNYIACKSTTVPMGPEVQSGTGRSGRTEIHDSSSMQEGEKHVYGT